MEKYEQMAKGYIEMGEINLRIAEEDLPSTAKILYESSDK